MTDCSLAWGKNCSWLLTVGFLFSFFTLQCKWNRTWGPSLCVFVSVDTDGWCSLNDCLSSPASCDLTSSSSSTESWYQLRSKMNSDVPVLTNSLEIFQMSIRFRTAISNWCSDLFHTSYTFLLCERTLWYTSAWHASQDGRYFTFVPLRSIKTMTWHDIKNVPADRMDFLWTSSCPCLGCALRWVGHSWNNTNKQNHRTVMKVDLKNV